MTKKEKKHLEYLKNRNKYLERSRVQRLNNSEKIKQYNKEYYLKNKDKLKEYQKKYCNDNKDIILAKKREYYAKNKELLNIVKVERTHKKRGNKYKCKINNFTFQEWIEIKIKQKNACALCGKKEPEIILTVDHILPLSKGGDNTKENIQALCLSCNSSKGNKLP